jgi:hypothetical protein
MKDGEVSPAPSDERVVHGVPLKAFAQGSRNRLPGEVPANAPGMRIVFQCVDIRPGATPLSERECKELLARGESPVRSLSVPGVR